MDMQFLSDIYTKISDVEKERLTSNNVVPDTNLYDSMCVPDLGAYLEYNTPPVLPGEERKPVATPVPAHTPTPAAPAPTNNNFLHEGKFLKFL